VLAINIILGTLVALFIRWRRKNGKRRSQKRYEKAELETLELPRMYGRTELAGVDLAAANLTNCTSSP